MYQTRLAITALLFVVINALPSSPQPFPSNVPTNATQFGTGSNITIESQNAIPVASVSEINRLLSDRIAYRLAESFLIDPTPDEILNLTARQAQAPPSSVDWRNRWGVSWLHTIQNQGSCDSCWAFAATALVESMVRIEHGIWSKRSEGDVRDGSLDSVPDNKMNYCKQSGSFVGALEWVQKNGVADLICWPYMMSDVHVSPGYKPCSDRSTGRIVRIPHGVISLGTDVEKQKEWIDKVGPVIANLDVPVAFTWHHGTGVYTSPAEGQPGANWHGQHSLLIVGYDDDRKAWLARNSWGTGWGDSGYGWIAYGEMRMDNHWHKYGLRYTDPDPWSLRRLHSGNLIQTGRSGNSHKDFELAVCRRDGNGVNWMRADGENNNFAWTPIANIWTPPPAGKGCQGQPVLANTWKNRDLDLLYWSTGNNLVHKHFDQNTRKWTDRGQFGNGQIGGYPSLIQYTSDGRLVSTVRHNDGSLHLYERIRILFSWIEVATIADKGVRMSGPSLIQTKNSRDGNLYTVAVMEDSTLQLFWQNPNTDPKPWYRGENFGWLIGWTPPVMIETNYATSTEHTIGDFEVFTVLGGRVIRYRRDNSDLRSDIAPVDFKDTQGSRWKLLESFLSPDGKVKHVWSVIQGPFAQNLEIVVELEDGRMQTMFHDWGSNSWKLSHAPGWSLPI